MSDKLLKDSLARLRQHANAARATRHPERRSELMSRIGLRPDVEIGQAEIEHGPQVEVGEAQLEHGPQVEMGEAEIEPDIRAHIGRTQYDDPRGPNWVPRTRTRVR